MKLVKVKDGDPSDWRIQLNEQELLKLYDNLALLDRLRIDLGVGLSDEKRNQLGSFLAAIEDGFYTYKRI